MNIFFGIFKFFCLILFGNYKKMLLNLPYKIKRPWRPMLTESVSLYYVKLKVMAKGINNALQQRWINFVREGMNYLKLSQKDLAQRAHVDPANLSRYLNGVSSPTLDMCYRILAAMYEWIPNVGFVPFEIPSNRFDYGKSYREK